jgi:hypothetical protein
MQGSDRPAEDEVTERPVDGDNKSYSGIQVIEQTVDFAGGFEKGVHGIQFA